MGGELREATEDSCDGADSEALLALTIHASPRTIRFNPISEVSLQCTYLT